MSDGNLPAWRLALQPGSFRNVPFGVKGVQTQVGRRTVIHEYPQRDEAYQEDLGRKARAFTIEAIVIGPDYMAARDALITALEERGPGQLVHPYYGRRTVGLANPARISESPDEGGMARFSLDFVEAGENTQPSARDDTPALVESRADEATATIADDFADGFSLDGLPSFAELSALDIAGDITSAIDSLSANLMPDLSILSEFMDAVGGVRHSLNELVRAPADFAGKLLGLFGGLTALATHPLAALSAYRGLFGYGSKTSTGKRFGSPLPSVPLTTPSRIRQAANHEAMAALTRRAALVEAARVSSRVAYDSYDQASTVRDQLADRLDDEAAGATVSEPVYEALTRMRVAMVRDITARGADLARVSSAQLPATLPAVVAAHRIFGDAARAGELVSRNGRIIRHPGFVPGGVALEILTRK